MNNNIKYNVRTIIKTDTNVEKDIVKLFNEKLFKIIISLENNSISQICQ